MYYGETIPADLSIGAAVLVIFNSVTSLGFFTAVFYAGLLLGAPHVSVIPVPSLETSVVLSFLFTYLAGQLAGIFSEEQRP